MSTVGVKVTTKLNRKALAEVLDLPEVTDATEKAAAVVLAAAKALAPVDTGNYRSSLHVEQVPALGGGTKFRVGAGTDYDVYVEADHGTLAKALDGGGA